MNWNVLSEIIKKCVYKYPQDSYILSKVCKRFRISEVKDMMRRLQLDDLFEFLKATDELMVITADKTHNVHYPFTVDFGLVKWVCFNNFRVFMNLETLTLIFELDNNIVRFDKVKWDIQYIPILY